MRVEYINPFVETSTRVLKEMLEGTEIRRGDLYLKSTAVPAMGVTALVGLAGDVEGRVLFDMTFDTALHIASKMIFEPVTEFNDLAKAAISELANIIAAQAVTKLHELGFKFDLTPPALFAGQNMEIAGLGKSRSENVEALIVPIEIQDCGKIEINVAVRDRA